MSPKHNSDFLHIRWLYFRLDYANCGNLPGVNRACARVRFQSDLYTGADNGATVTDPLEPIRVIGTILDGLDVAMCAFDREDRTVLWNRAFLRFFPEHAGHVFSGEPYRDNLRRFYLGRLAAAELDDIERYIDEGIARHHAQARPYSFRHKQNWVRVSSLPMPDGGRVRIWRREPTPHLDDTEEGAHPLRQGFVPNNTEVFEHVGDGVMLTDPDNVITWVNEHFVDMFEMPDKQAALGRSFESVYQSSWARQPESRSALIDAAQSTLVQNLKYAGSPFELPLPRGRWVRVIEQRRRDGVGFFALVDISLLKRQQEELIAAEREARESRELLAEKSRVLEATLQRMEQGVMMVDRAGTVVVCNRKAMELLDLPASLMDSNPSFAEVLEHQWAIDEFVGATEEVQIFVRGGGILDRPHRYERRRPNGQVIEVQSVPIEGGGVLRSYTDITERKRAEATQRILEAQLREAQRLEAIGTLAGGIAHDFNNIMAAILGNVAFAEESTGLGHPAQLYLGQINKAGRRARSLVQQILAFSREQSSEFIDFSLVALVEETIAMLRAMFDESIELTKVLPERSLGVRGNPTQVQQVLMNLGTNASQALGPPGGHIEIGVEELAVDATEPLAPLGLESGRYVRLWVRDNGRGMDHAVRERIFEPFFTTKPVGVGTGLGLAVAHGVVEAHRGAIAVDSLPGRGSTFSVYLPLVEHETVPAQLEPLAGPPTRGEGQHILYVDDDEVMRLMVRGLLERLGYRATCARDVQEALSVVGREKQDVDVVVTDFNMPGATGLDLAKALSDLHPELPVIISSGYISDELRASAALLGVEGLIRKEHTLEELGPFVQLALLRRRSSAGTAR